MAKESLQELKEIASDEDSEHETEDSDLDHDKKKLTDNNENESELDETSSRGFRSNENAWKARARNLAAKIPRPPRININKQLVLTKIFYFFFFAAVGSLLPFLGVYYKQLWLSAKQVGILIGIRPTVKLLCSPLWGMVSDTYNKPKMVLLVATLGWLVGYYGQSFVSPNDLPCYNSTIYANFTTDKASSVDSLIIHKRGFKVKQFLKIPRDVGQTLPSGDAKEISSFDPVIKSLTRRRRNLFLTDDSERDYINYHLEKFAQQVAGSNSRRDSQGKENNYEGNEEKQKGIISNTADGYKFSEDPINSQPGGFDANGLRSFLENKDKENMLNQMVSTETERQLKNEKFLVQQYFHRENDKQSLNQGKQELSDSFMRDSKKGRKYPEGSSHQSFQSGLPSKDSVSDDLQIKSLDRIQQNSKHQERNLQKDGVHIKSLSQIQEQKDDYLNEGEKKLEGAPSPVSSVVLDKADENSKGTQDGRQSSGSKQNFKLQEYADEERQADEQVNFVETPPSDSQDFNAYGTQYDSTLTDVSIFTGPKLASPHPPDDYRVLYNKQIFLVLLTIIILSEILATPAPMVVDSGTLQLLEMYGKRKDYGKQRLFGSFGWMLGAIIAGGIVTANITCNFTDTISYVSCFHVFAAFMALTFIVASFFEFETAPKLEYEISKETLWKALKSFCNFRGGGFLLTVFFCGFWHSIFMSFLFWFLQDIEGTPIIYALVLVLNSLTEVVVFFTSDFIIQYWSNVGMVYMGLVCYGVRFLFYTYLERPWLVLPMEVLQGFTFGGVWTAAINNMKGANPSHQSLLHGVYWGLGMAVGGVVSGVMIDFVGTRLTFLINSVAVVVILGIFWLTNKNDFPPTSPSSPSADDTIHKKRRLSKTSSRTSVGPLGPLVPSLLYGKHFV